MTMLLRRQMMRKVGGGGLPAEYQQVAYLESSGTQRIETNYTPVIGDEISTTINPYSSGNQRVLFSAGSETYQTILLYNKTGSFFKYFATGNAQIVNIDADTSTKFDLKSDGSVYINDVYKGRSAPAGELDGNATNLWLFMRRNGQAGLIGTIGRFTISNSNTVKIDLIPCIRIADSKPGMYDLVGRQFYTNQGTGEFIAGLAPDLSDTDYWSIAGYFNASGAITSSTGYSMCDYQPIIGGNAYTLNLSTNNWKGLGFYDEQYNPLEFSQNANYTNPITITAPANTKYYRIYVDKTSQGIKFELVNPTE